jgi:transcriptional regulator with XRE-family HTH domain
LSEPGVSNSGRYDTQGATLFGHELYRAIDAAGMNARDFALRVRVSTGYLSNLRCGRRRPPLERIRGWAKTLRLSTDLTRRFVFLGFLMHCPAEIRDLVMEAHANLEELARSGERSTRVLDRFRGQP